MANSPAMLLYTKDWLTGTAEMEPGEKGIYIDLMCYQQINGSLPTDINKLAKLCSVSINQFRELWAGIKHKFVEIDGRLVNQKVKQVVEQNETKALKNKINGSLPRILEKFELKKAEKKKVYARLYESINYNDFKDKSDSDIKQTLNQMVDQVVNYIADVNVNAKGDEEEKEDILNYPWQENEFIEVWKFWKKFKLEQFKFIYQPIGEQGAINDLYELSGGDLSMAMLIVKQSIQKGWKGFFELKGEAVKEMKNKSQHQENIEYFKNMKK